MPTTVLSDTLGKDPIRDKVVADCETLIDNQVRGKGGFSGVAIKTAYATIRAIKKRFVAEVVDGLLDEWLTNLEPHHEAWAAKKSGSFADHLIGNADRVAEDMLAVTDKRAERTTHTTVKKLYGTLRSSAKKNVVEAVPELARLLDRHLQAATA